MDGERILVHGQLADRPAAESWHCRPFFTTSLTPQPHGAVLCPPGGAPAGISHAGLPLPAKVRGPPSGTGICWHSVTWVRPAKSITAKEDHMPDHSDEDGNDQESQHSGEHGEEHSDAEGDADSEAIEGSEELDQNGEEDCDADGEEHSASEADPPAHH